MGGYGRVYKGILAGNRPVAVKKLDDKDLQCKNEFYTEVRMLSQYHHKNIVTLIGFCDEGNEIILIYEYVPNGSLDTYLNDASKLNSLRWLKRLKICVGAARALEYLHNRVAKEHRVIHRDIKSSNILLDENWDAKISDFGLSRIGLSNQENTFLITNVAGTYGYCDPQYERTGILTKESDVYSFGVVLFEVLCGRLVLVARYHDERRFLHNLARRFFKKGEIYKIIDHRIRENIRPKTLTKFSTIAYQCLQERREERPTMAQVVQELESALQIQLESYLSPNDAASIIGRRFRSFLVRRSHSFLALRELAVAKAKLKELKTLFYDDSYRKRIAHDAEERRRYVEKIIVLLLTVDVIEGRDVLVMATRRSVLEKLEKMMDGVDPQPQGINNKEFDMMHEWRHVLQNQADGSGTMLENKAADSPAVAIPPPPAKHSQRQQFFEQTQAPSCSSSGSGSGSSFDRLIGQTQNMSVNTLTPNKEEEPNDAFFKDLIEFAKAKSLSSSCPNKKEKPEDAYFKDLVDFAKRKSLFSSSPTKKEKPEDAFFKDLVDFAKRKSSFSSSPTKKEKPEDAYFKDLVDFAKRRSSSSSPTKKEKPEDAFFKDLVDFAKRKSSFSSSPNPNRSF